MVRFKGSIGTVCRYGQVNGPQVKTSEEVSELVGGQVGRHT